MRAIRKSECGLVPAEAGADAAQGRMRLEGSRILFVLPSLELGGAERQALRLAAHLARRGASVTVWGNSAPGLVCRLCEELGIPWDTYEAWWPSRKLHLARSVRRAFRFRAALCRLRPSAILAYCPRPCVCSGLVWRLSPAGVCIWGQRDTGDLRGDRVERFAYRRVSAVVCNAAHEVHYLRQTLGRTDAPVHVVHNGVELDPPAAGRDEWRARLGIDRGAVVATMLANFRAQKDHATLLRAWRMLLDSRLGHTVECRLVLAGAEGESLAQVRRLTQELALEHAVAFPGQVIDVSGLLAASDIGVLSSSHEGLSNAVIEYMLSGLPVVATDLPANRETLGDNACAQICRGRSPEELMARLRNLIESPAQRATIGRSNRVRAMSEYSVMAMCSRTEQILTELLRVAAYGAKGARA